MPLRHHCRDRLRLIVAGGREMFGDLQRGRNQFPVAPGFAVDDQADPVGVAARDFQDAIACPS
jgi:hypothetical protein